MTTKTLSFIILAWACLFSITGIDTNKASRQLTTPSVQHNADQIGVRYLSFPQSVCHTEVIMIAAMSDSATDSHCKKSAPNPPAPAIQNQQQPADQRMWRRDNRVNRHRQFIRT